MVILCYYGIDYRSLFGILNRQWHLRTIYSNYITPLATLVTLIIPLNAEVEMRENLQSINHLRVPEISISDNLELNYIFTTDGYDLGLVNTSQLDDNETNPRRSPLILQN